MNIPIMEKNNFEDFNGNNQILKIIVILRCNTKVNVPLVIDSQSGYIALKSIKKRSKKKPIIKLQIKTIRSFF